jgi:hypothetical protein
MDIGREGVRGSREHNDICRNGRPPFDNVVDTKRKKYAQMEEG